MVDEMGESDTVGLKPVFGMLPTRGDFALGGKVDDSSWLDRVQEGKNLFDVPVQVESVEAKSAAVAITKLPRGRFRRATDTDHFVSGIE
jgi:ribosomal protein L16/L10AE